MIEFKDPDLPEFQKRPVRRRGKRNRSSISAGIFKKNHTAGVRRKKQQA
ncbi:MAG: hypothetical protein ABIJ15_00145 [bacterium]